MTCFAFNRSHLGLFMIIYFLTACAPIIPASPVAETTILPNTIQPPPATLTINNKTQTAGIGAYCWSDPSSTPSVGVCADIAGIPTGREPLVSAETPFTATIHLPLDAPPDSLYIAVMPAIHEIDSSQKNVRLWQPAGGWSGALPLKNEVKTVFQESTGLYLFQLNAR